MVEPPDDMNVELGEITPAVACTDGPSVLINASALLAMNLHAASEPGHEIGGIMLGSLIEGSGLVVVVEDIIRGTKMDHSSGSVTFTHETWSEINRIKDEQFPDKKVVGWYHSHPGFGIFLSGHDLFIQKNFFSQPYHVAFVTDPRARTCGTFVWQGEGIVQEEFGVLTSADAFDYPSLSPENQAPDAPPFVAAAAPAELPPPPALAGKRDLSLMIGMGLLGMLLTMILLITVTNFLNLEKLSKSVAGLKATVESMQSNVSSLLSRPASQPQVPPTYQPLPGSVPATGAVQPNPPSATGGDAQAPPGTPMPPAGAQPGP